jgi:hypothetical protein
MNPHTSNPLMFILEAAPERYINTPAAAVVAVIKAVEGVVAFLWCFRMLDCIRQIVAGRLGIAPVGVLLSLLPGDLTRLVLPSGVPLDGTLGTVLSGAAALSVLAVLLCMAAEAAAAVLLRFFMQGAKLFRATRKWIFVASVALTVCVALSSLPGLLDFLYGGFRLDASMQPVVVSLLAVLPLILYVCYNRSAAVVMEAVEYEIRLGFKETGMQSVRLGWFAFLLGLLMLAAAAALFVFARPEARYAFAFLLPAIKFFAVWQSWRAFRKRHR